MPQIVEMSVVLPAPFGPSSARISPSSMSRLTPLQRLEAELVDFAKILDRDHCRHRAFPTLGGHERGVRRRRSDNVGHPAGRAISECPVFGQTAYSLNAGKCERRGAGSWQAQGCCPAAACRRSMSVPGQKIEDECRPTPDTCASIPPGRATRPSRPSWARCTATSARSVTERSRPTFRSSRGRGPSGSASRSRPSTGGSTTSATPPSRSRSSRCRSRSSTATRCASSDRTS